MATSLHIDGPCEVVYDGTVLGITDNDDLPSFQLTQMQKEIKSVSGGDVPTAHFATSSSISISLTLVKWDDAVLNTLLTQIGSFGGGPIGYGPIIGIEIIGKELSLRRIGGSAIITFPNTMLRPDAISQSRFGNVERRLTIHAIAYPDTGLGALFYLGNI
jgi:hypothetical protein